jgi:predicted O-methyltransferase YrrM
MLVKWGARAAAGLAVLVAAFAAGLVVADQPKWAWALICLMFGLSVAGCALLLATTRSRLLAGWFGKPQPSRITKALEGLSASQARSQADFVEALTTIRRTSEELTDGLRWLRTDWVKVSDQLQQASAGLEQTSARLTAVLEQQPAEEDLPAALQATNNALDKQADAVSSVQTAAQQFREEVGKQLAELAKLNQTTQQQQIAAANHVEQLGSALPRQFEALLRLYGFSAEQPTLEPGLYPTALPATTQLTVLRILTQQKAKLVVELGSGAATAALANWASQTPDRRLISVHHQSAVITDLGNDLTSTNLDHAVSLRHAELGWVDIGDQALTWYDPTKLADLAQIDLLLVAGPPVGDTDQARYPALDLLLPKLAPGAIIILDCTDPNSQAVAKRWSTEYSQLVPLQATASLAAWQFAETGSSVKAAANG